MILIRDLQGSFTEERRFQVGRNLHSFLNAARNHEHLADPFWIDALCIDQQDGRERNHQVRQMGQIYARCIKVVVWLGRLSKKFDGFEGQADREELWRGINRNAYWNRAWITQEFVLPQQVLILIHKALVSFSEIRAAVHTWHLAAILKIAHMRNRWHDERILPWSKKPSLFRIPVLDQQCSIPRDRVYSLLSLVREGSRIMVDYDTNALELTHQLLGLWRGPLELRNVVSIIHVLRDEINDSIVPSADFGPFVDFRVVYTKPHEDPTPLHAGVLVEYQMWLVDVLLSGRSIRSATTKWGDGFEITREHERSLMLRVRVALAVIAAQPLPPTGPVFAKARDHRVDSELDLWATRSLPWFNLSRILPNSREKAWKEWSLVKLGYGRIH